MTPLRCRIFGHDYRDPFNGWPIHFYFPCEEGYSTLVGRCRRCGDEWWYGTPPKAVLIAALGEEQA